MHRHQWRDDTEDGTRFYCATHHAGRWSYTTQLKGEEDWETIEADQEFLQALREILWAKYQRRRCTWKIIQSVDKVLLKEFGVEPPQQN